MNAAERREVESKGDMKQPRYCFGDVCTELTVLTGRQKRCAPCQRKHERDTHKARRAWRRKHERGYIEMIRKYELSRYLAKAKTPAYLAEKAAYKRQLYKANPAFRQRCLENSLQWRQQNMPRPIPCTGQTLTGKPCGHKSVNGTCRWHRAQPTPRGDGEARRHRQGDRRGPVSRFWCWACELWYGDEDAPLEASRLCDSCKAARKR